ncbi:MAG: Type restriction-modification system endonuclease (modular protein) [Deltaproteobacteria bacterium]|nr:Type restriction-modification system endonuclease (modular protein) [Deltaproteobacteria bacterium]
MGYKSINSPNSNTAVLELFKEGRCAMNLELSRNGKLTPQQLRQQLQQAETSDLRRRRGVIGLSLVGMGCMTAVTLLQTGIVKHLPDPPIGNFDSDRVNSSDTAYRLGAPDGSISLASLAANIPIAAFGGANRVQTKPWVPLVAALKAAGELVFLSDAGKGKGVVRLLHRRRAGKHWHRGSNHTGGSKSHHCFDD